MCNGLHRSFQPFGEGLDGGAEVLYEGKLSSIPHQERSPVSDP